MVLGTCFGLARMKNGGFGVKGSKLGSVTSRQATHESSTLLAVTSRQPFTSRQPCNFFKESQLFSFEQFSYFRHNFFYQHPN